MIAAPQSHPLRRVSGRPSPRRVRGFTLTELMVAILLGLFIMGGVLTLIQSMKRTTGMQSNLSQLQDNERFTTDLINDVVQSAGNFPGAAGGTKASSVFPAVTVAVQGIPTAGLTIPFVSNQIIAGLDTGSPQGGVIAIRYATSGTDNLVGCDGNTSAGAAVTWINIFSIDANNNVQCQLYTMDSAGNTLKTSTTTIANGVTSLGINYALTTNVSAGTHTPDAYLTATQVLALPSSALPSGVTDHFSYCKTVQMQFTLTNPLFGQASQPPTIPVTRVFQVMTQSI